MFTPRCLTVNRLIFPYQDKSLLYHLFLLADSQLIYSLISLFFLWIIIRDGCIYYNSGLCFLEAISRGVVSSCWWMLANRRCQTQCSLSFITSLKDVPLGILTRPLPPLHSLRKSLVILQQLCPDIVSGDGGRGLQVIVTDETNSSKWFALDTWFIKHTDWISYETDKFLLLVRKCDTAVYWLNPDVCLSNKTKGLKLVCMTCRLTASEVKEGYFWSWYEITVSGETFRFTAVFYSARYLLRLQM